MVRQQLNMERHLEREKVICKWIKMKCQEKKEWWKGEKVNQINEGNRHLEEALTDPAVNETFWTDYLAATDSSLPKILAAVYQEKRWHETKE